MAWCALDLVLASNNVESLGVAHHVDTSHVSTHFTTDGALALLEHLKSDICLE